MPGGPDLPSWLRVFLPQVEEEADPILAEVVVEYNKASLARYLDSNLRPRNFPKIYHKWGETAFNPLATDIRVEFVQENGQKLPPVAKRYKLQREEKLKDGKNTEVLLDLAEWALTHSLLEEYTKVIEELRELDSKHPTVVAFDYYQTEMKKRLTKVDDAIVWKNQMGNKKEKQTAHYVLLYTATETEPDEVKDYAERLEENYLSFFYWFALKGKKVKVPDRRLVAVLLDKPDEFYAYREAFDHAPMVADGFFSRRDNLAVFSAKRLDEVYDLLSKATNPLWQTGWNQSDLLNGKGRPGSQPDEIVRNQVLALLLRAMQDESARASVSHEASRQLAVATGMISTTVAVPEWIQFGMGSFFETPTGAFWPGVGAPSWRYLVKYKVWRKADQDVDDKIKAEIEKAKKEGKPIGILTDRVLDRPPEAIRKVITDAYFREAAKDDTKKTPLLKARTLSWGLTYFLMHRKTEQLLKYFQELEKLPRDIEFDDDTLIMTFGRAFDMVETTSTGPVMNTAKLDKLGEEWFSFLDMTPIESSEAMQDAVKQYQEQNKKKANQPATAKKPSWKPPEIKLPTRRPKK